MISEEQIEQFRTMYKARFGIEIGKEEAMKHGQKLVTLIGSIYKQIKK